MVGRFPIKVFNAEAQRRRVRREVLGKLECGEGNFGWSQ